MPTASIDMGEGPRNRAYRKEEFPQTGKQSVRPSAVQNSDMIGWHMA